MAAPQNLREHTLTRRLSLLYRRNPPKASPQTIVLLETGAAHGKGSEVRISYGDKSNEELLFVCGFAVARNPNDLALLAPPLPPAVEVDDVLQMRLALCDELGVEPRTFLPLAALREGQKAAEAALLGAGWRPAWWSATPCFTMCCPAPAPAWCSATPSFALLQAPVPETRCVLIFRVHACRGAAALRDLFAAA